MKIFKEAEKTMNNGFNINWTVPFTGLLVTLKALGYLDWSWWLVFAPIWVPFSIVISIFAAYIAFSFVVAPLVAYIACKLFSK